MRHTCESNSGKGTRESPRHERPYVGGADGLDRPLVKDVDGKGHYGKRSNEGAGTESQSIQERIGGRDQGTNQLDQLSRRLRLTNNLVPSPRHLLGRGCLRAETTCTPPAGRRNPAGTCGQGPACRRPIGDPVNRPYRVIRRRSRPGPATPAACAPATRTHWRGWSKAGAPGAGWSPRAPAGHTF